MKCMIISLGQVNNCNRVRFLQYGRISPQLMRRKQYVVLFFVYYTNITGLVKVEAVRFFLPSLLMTLCRLCHFNVFSYKKALFGSFG